MILCCGLCLYIGGYHVFPHILPIKFSDSKLFFIVIFSHHIQQLFKSRVLEGTDFCQLPVSSGFKLFCDLFPIYLIIPEERKIFFNQKIVVFQVLLLLPFQLLPKQRFSLIQHLLYLTNCTTCKKKNIRFMIYQISPQLWLG